MNGNPLHERQAFLEEAEAHLRQGDHLKVLSLAEARLKGTPGDLDARIMICRVWIEQERLEEAGEMLREMEEILAGLARIYTYMGDIYLRKGMAEPAQDFYRTFVSLSPDTPMAHAISERLKGLSGQPVTGGPERTEKEEPTPVPDSFQTVTLAELYARQGHLQMAEEILAAILSRGPHHPKAAALLREVRDRIAHQEQAGQSPEPATPGEADREAADRLNSEAHSEPVTVLKIGEEDVSPEAADQDVEPVFLRESPEGITDQEKPAERTAAESSGDFPEKTAIREKAGDEPKPPVPGETGRREADRQFREAGSEGIIFRTFERRGASEQESRMKPAALLIRDLEEFREKIVSPRKPVEPHAATIAELSRWLSNIGRLDSHAG